MTFELRGVVAPPLDGAELVFDRGLSVVLGTGLDGAALLAPLAAGLVVPRRGAVLVAGSAPHRTPSIRRRIGTLFAREDLPAAATVKRAVALLSSGRADGTLADAALAAVGLDKWADRDPSTLLPAERRSVALSVALSIPSPVLLVLTEPLADVPGTDEKRVRQLIEEARTSAVVVCVTSSLRHAMRLGKSLTLLDRGRFVRRMEHIDDLVPGAPTDLVVRTTEPRILLTALAAETDVVGVDFSEAIQPNELRTRGRDLGRLALSIARAAKRSGAPIQAIVPALPDLEAVRIASEALVTAAWERARRAAYPRVELDRQAYAQHTQPNPEVDIAVKTNGQKNGEPTA